MPRSTGQLGHVRASHRRGAGRPLCDPAPNRGRTVHGRRSRPGTDPAAGEGAGADRAHCQRRRGADHLRVVRAPSELDARPRAVALGTFDGVHLGHRQVRETVLSTAPEVPLAEGDLEGASRLLGRPPEVDGTVVSGDARGGTLGYPTANLRVDPDLLVPAYGIYAGWAAGHRAAVSIGTNPHYGGRERRVEAFLLDFDGDLYGERLIVELWRRLRDEQAFASEEELVAQIARDVEATQAAERPL